MAAFVDVVLRGLALSGQAVAVGGVLFALLVLLRAPQTAAPAWSRVWTLVAFGAAIVAVTKVLSLAVLGAALGASPSALLEPLASTTFVQASLAKAVAALMLVAAAVRLRRRAPTAAWWSVVLVASGALVLSSAAMSHGVARLAHRALLTALDAIHQLAAAAWIGGLAHLIVTTSRSADDRFRVAVLRRFSTLALTAVALLMAAGIGLTVAYVDGVTALVGTAYGIMVLTKVVILAGLLGLGALNFRAVRGLTNGAGAAPHVRRLVEVELGLGITVLFAAASLTSLPPAVDVVADRATYSEVATRFTPRWPSFSSPSIDELPVDDPDAPRTDADRAWSEYNHHVSGLFVLTMGVLAVLHVFGGVRWARHWPLVLLGLAAFMLVRNDPGAWPLGPQGFWESMKEPSVLQHRLFVVLIVVFALFEWMVRTGRLVAPGFALFFPILCAVGGGLLLTHSHASLNLKTEFLVEVTHAPLGVLGIAIGWARWLELRLAAPEDRIPSRVWACALALFGVLLLIYRES
jgi:putative copper resistance protein D